MNTVATDHCPFFYETQKIRGRDDFSRIPGGAPGIETRLTLLYTHGVRTGRLSLERWVEVCCTEPARRFGLAPRKGTLAVGADADMVIFDPEHRAVLSHETLHQNVDYCPYEGWQVQGYPRDGSVPGGDHCPGGTVRGRGRAGAIPAHSPAGNRVTTNLLKGKTFQEVQAPGVPFIGQRLPRSGQTGTHLFQQPVHAQNRMGIELQALIIALAVQR